MQQAPSVGTYETDPRSGALAQLLGDLQASEQGLSTAEAKCCGDVACRLSLPVVTNRVEGVC